VTQHPPQYYRELADACARDAEREKDQLMKKQWLFLRDHWIALARHAEGLPDNADKETD